MVYLVYNLSVCPDASQVSELPRRPWVESKNVFAIGDRSSSHWFQLLLFLTLWPATQDLFESYSTHSAIYLKPLTRTLHQDSNDKKQNKNGVFGTKLKSTFAVSTPQMCVQYEMKQVWLVKAPNNTQKNRSTVRMYAQTLHHSWTYAAAVQKKHSRGAREQRAIEKFKNCENSAILVHIFSCKWTEQLTWIYLNMNSGLIKHFWCEMKWT